MDVWRRVDVKHADIAFRGPKRDFVSVISDCDAETARRPHRLASGLLVGVENRRKVDAGVLDASSGEGWYQVYEARFDGQPVRIKTVTMVRGECVLDWVLVSPGNFGLAERRALSVANFLRAAGIAGERLEVRGFGSTRPIASNDTEEGRGQNRRVEIVIDDDLSK